MEDGHRPPDVPADEGAAFARQAAGKPPGLLKDLFGLLRHNRKWWLVPVLVVLLAVGLLVLLGSTVLGPFLYPLF